ncbi:hypothetical protein [Nocardiopsis sp. NPDC058789]|uniref:hypothetical protein n=1 Tax=Nocardiopsis sp. NPDC058789 TaxID=3346634 RepID=UPI00366CE739
MLVPYTIEQDEDGVWCARAVLRAGVSAHGEGDTPDAALADLRTAFALLTEEFGSPAELL